MRELFGRYSWPLVSLGGLLAIACLASTLYITRLQSDLAQTIRHDPARMEAADELQIRLRQLRFHSLMFAADTSDARLKVVDEDRRLVVAAIVEAHRESHTPDDLKLLEAIEQGYREYEAGLGLGVKPGPPVRSGAELIQWADAHPVQGLLTPCRELEDRQRERMNASLERSELQTAWRGVYCWAWGSLGPWRASSAATQRPAG